MGSESDQERGRTGTLSKIAYDRISSAIVYGRLDFGEPLSEGELANALGMSKAPVRMAISELKMRGLVEIIPQSGTYVFTPGPDEITQLSEFRFALEEQGLRLSMERNPGPLVADLIVIVEEMRSAYAAGSHLDGKRLDSRFHWSLIRNADNKYLAASYESISLQVEALRYRYIDASMFHSRGLSEHERLLAAVSTGKVIKAIDLLREHIDHPKEHQIHIRWPKSRSQRKYYKARDYATILTT